MPGLLINPECDFVGWEAVWSLDETNRECVITRYGCVLHAMGVAQAASESVGYACVRPRGGIAGPGALFRLGVRHDQAMKLRLPDVDPCEVYAERRVHGWNGRTSLSPFQGGYGRHGGM